MWKIQLAIIINFFSSKDDKNEEHERYSKSNNIEIMMNDERKEVLEELFESIKKGTKISWDDQ